MSLVTLSRLEKLTGIRAHTFRTWEQRYALLKNLRTTEGWRTYTIDQTRLLLHISLLNKAGYKISGIAGLPAEAIAAKAFTLSTDELKQHRAVHALFLYMLSLEPDHFELVLNSCIQHWGLSKTITDVLVPFLEKTGLLYEHSGSTAETLVLSLVRHKLIAGIEQLPPPMADAETALLFLPERQHHDLALLYMYYRLKQYGVPVLYAGVHTPMETLKQMVLLRPVRFAYTCLLKRGTANVPGLAAFFNEHIPDTSLLVFNAIGPEPCTCNAPNLAVYTNIHDTHHMMLD